jgi:hypothetical protein
MMKVKAGLARRGFLRRIGLGSAGALAVGSLADVLAAPAATAGTKRARSLRQTAHLAFFEMGQASPSICSGQSECRPCRDCCPEGRCGPSGVSYCFVCRGTCGNGTICIDHPPLTFTTCCH